MNNFIKGHRMTDKEFKKWILNECDKSENLLLNFNEIVEPFINKKSFKNN